MNSFKSVISSLLIAIAVAASPFAAHAAADGPMVKGQVKEVRPNGDLTIKHGPIPNLDMSAMTMVFKMSDPKIAKGIKTGDKIKFHAEDVGGKLTVMHIEKAK